jgi:hypothetical protein
MLLGLLLACSSPSTPTADKAGDDSAAAGDSAGPEDSAPADDSAAIDPFCDDQPVVTWANFGAGFLLGACQGCHASTTPDRHGAPEGVSFDNVDEAWAWQPRILARATGEAPTMPPLGGINEADRLLLEIWLRCAAAGT